MALTIPIRGLQYSYDGSTYYDIPVAPDTMDLELEQVTANTYRTVGPKSTLYNDFLCVIAKVSCTWSVMSRTEYSVLSSLFYSNKFIYLRFSNPDLRNERSEFIACQFKCGNLKFAYTFVDKTTGHPKEYANVSQSYTQREAT